MHPSAYAFATSALTGDDVTGKKVVEAGAFDVNGSVRGHTEALQPASYTGTDMRAGPGVDLVCLAEDLPAELGEDSADVVISTEMLEHAADWQAAVRGMITLLAPGGLLVLTARGPGFPLHGYPEDHWRFTTEAMDAIIKGAGLDVLQLEADLPTDPGVLVQARKPADWAWPDGAQAAWDDAGVQPAVTGAPR
jgi:SAM-dependent methyltransferase